MAEAKAPASSSDAIAEALKRWNRAEERERDNMVASTVRAILDYSPADGVFRWKQKISRKVIVGKIAGTINGGGYRQIQIAGTMCRASRLAWLYVHGEWPPDQIDHINGNRADDRIANLRLADQSQNNANRRAPRTNTSGLKGVSFIPQSGKWQAHIQWRRAQKNLGSFPTAEEAHAAYVAAARALFGDFVRAA